MDRRLLALLACFALVVGACSGGGEAVDMEDGEIGGTAAEGGGTGTEGTGGEDGDDDAGGGVLRAALGGDPDKLDPQTTSSAFAFKVLENVYDTLVQPGDDLQPEPALATEWETSEDLLTWTFTLREGVTFHDGSAFDAEDVKASYERIMAVGANAFRLDAVESMEAVDELTFEITLTRPAPNLLVQLGAFKGMAIIPSEIASQTPTDAPTDGETPAGDPAEQALNDQPVGTGPFRLTDFTPGSSITLEAHDDYWGGPDLPRLDGVEYRIIPDESVKLTNLETGEVDWIDTVPPQQLASLEQRDDIEVGRVAGNDYWYMATNIAREPWSDRNVRRAIAFALDPAQIAKAAKFDAATPNETAIPEASFWYHEYAPYGRDVEQAQTLLDEAGVSNLTMDLMVTNEYPETVTAAEVIANQLGDIGIDVQIRTEDFSTWLADQGEGEFDAFMLGWLGNIDPDDFYYAQHHSEGGFNFHGYSNPEVDELLDAGRRETDQEARKQIYDQVAELIVDDASYIYFYNPDIVNAWSPDVQGYETRPDNAVRFVETSLAG